MMRLTRLFLLLAGCLRAAAVPARLLGKSSLEVEQAKASTSELTEPAVFNATAAQKAGKCAAPFMAGNSMYLAALGSSVTGGQWGSWQLSDDPDSPATATWKLDFMAPDWQTVRISSDAGSLSIVAKPIEKADLQREYGWLREGGSGFSEGGWSFMEELNAPVVGYVFDSLNYTVARVEDSYPARYTASPTLQDAALPLPEWQHWAITDCQDDLSAVLMVEKTNGTRPGRTVVLNKAGEIAAEVLADPVVARYQFLDINKRLLAVAEAPTLGSRLPMESLPRRSNLGNVLPYNVHFELGGYNYSSSLLKEEFRWILGTAIQVRALQDAHAGFEPPFIKDRYLLLSIVLALILIVVILIVSILTGSFRTASRIFFYRDKANMPFYAAPAPVV